MKHYRNKGICILALRQGVKQGPVSLKIDIPTLIQTLSHTQEILYYNAKMKLF